MAEEFTSTTNAPGLAEVLAAHGPGAISWLGDDGFCATCEYIGTRSDDISDAALECAHLEAKLTAAGLLRVDPCCTPRQGCISGTWLVDVHDHCTCGGAGGPFPHEPGCGLTPVVDLATLDGWDELVTYVKGDDRG